MRTFLSYSFAQLRFVSQVHRYLDQQRPRVQPYFYTKHRNTRAFPQQLTDAIVQSDVFILFLGKKLGEFQSAEMRQALVTPNIKHKIWVRLADDPDERASVYTGDLDPIRVNVEQVEAADDREALACAREILRLLRIPWIPPDDIPNGYLFDYEKEIIDAYLSPDSKDGDERIPQDWPKIEEIHYSVDVRNPVSWSAIGDYRTAQDLVAVDAKIRPDGKQLSFPEAGPREILRFPDPEHSHQLRVGVLVSGGIAPGINAVIAGIVHRHFLYASPPREQRNPEAASAPYEVQVYGYLEGFKALLRGAGNHVLLTPEGVSGHAHEGGSMIGTSRVPELLSPSLDNRMQAIREVIQTLASDRIEILYVIGGDGSMRAAHAIWTVAKNERPDLNLSVVGIPKTMDNDILWVWQSFGFLSAVDKAKEAILQLQTEVKSNPRLCVIQLFGSDSGFVVAHAVLASGGCDYALIPEVGFTMETMCNRMKEVLIERYRREQRPFGIIVMSETAVPRDVEACLNYVELSPVEKDAVERFAGIGAHATDKTFRWRVQGQTPDELRTGGLKIVTNRLQQEIQKIPGLAGYWKTFRVFSNEPRHIIRAIPPSVSDVIFAQRLGTLAVDNAMAGYTDFMVSQWLTEYVLVPLKLVVLGRKRVPTNGIFWKSVLASTKQPMEMFDDLTEPPTGSSEEVRDLKATQ